LLKTIAAHSNKDRKNGSWTDGRKLVSNYLLGLGVHDKEFYIDDGSGLSRKNKLSANAITKVLSHVYKGKNWKLYKDSLAIGGVDGTARRHFQEKKYKGKVFGKTGYIAGVKSFSGVCSTAEGDYIFSILTNKANGPTRTAINDIVKALF
jgi:D-alanyl-D-alanine carboxypeptidase/D-alanyl-D-alanine-endopeptidase (penicillin-binding protein 4)